MITAFPLSQPSMLGFTIDGEVDDEGLRRLLLALEAKVAAHGRVRLLGNVKRIGSFESFESFGKLLRAKSGVWDHVEKYAILTDHDWLGMITSGVDWLTPRTEVRTFKLSEGEVAHQWLKLPPVVPPPAEGFREVDLADGHLLGIAIIGKLNVPDYDRLNSLIEEQVKKHGRAKLLIEIVDLGDLSFRTLLEDLRTGIRFYRKLDRVAFVGDQGWLRPSAALGDLILPGVEVAAFGTTDRGRAVAWLG